MLRAPPRAPEVTANAEATVGAKLYGTEGANGATQRALPRTGTRAQGSPAGPRPEPEVPALAGAAGTQRLVRRVRGCAPHKIHCQGALPVNTTDFAPPGWILVRVTHLMRLGNCGHGASGVAAAPEADAPPRLASPVTATTSGSALRVTRAFGKTFLQILPKSLPDPGGTTCCGDSRGECDGWGVPERTPGGLAQPRVRSAPAGGAHSGPPGVPAVGGTAEARVARGGVVRRRVCRRGRRGGRRR
jgi:hypothetical protein